MTLAYCLDPGTIYQRESMDNRSKGITEVLEKDSVKAGNWSNESWKAEQLLG